MDHYRMDDIDAAAAAFPDLQFEVVHGGFAFIEETAFQLARFSNVWVNLETTSNLAVAKPGAFERVMAGLIAHAGEGALRSPTTPRSVTRRTKHVNIHPVVLIMVEVHRYLENDGQFGKIVVTV